MSIVKIKSTVLKGHEKPITQMQLTREGDYFVSCSADKSALLWNATTYEIMGEYTCAGAVSSCSISNDGQRLYLSSRDGSINCFEFETGKKIYSKLPVKDCIAPVKCVELTPNNDHLLCVIGNFRSYKSTVYQLDTGLVNEPVALFSQEMPQLTKAKWLSNDIILAGDELGNLFLKDLRTKNDHMKFESHKNEITDIQTDLNSILLGTTGKDGKAFVHDIRNPKDVITQFEAGYPLQSIGFAPYRDFFAVGGGQDKAMITLTHRDMTMLMTTFISCIDGEEIVRLSGHFGTVNTILFSHDGKTIYTGADDGCIRISPLTHSTFA